MHRSLSPVEPEIQRALTVCQRLLLSQDGSEFALSHMIHFAEAERTSYKHMLEILHLPLLFAKISQKKTLFFGKTIDFLSVMLYNI